MSEKIDLKDLEIKALLEITQAINNNLSESDLYRIYKFTLLGELRVGRILLLVQDKKWEAKAYFGLKNEYLGDHPPDYLLVKRSEHPSNGEGYWSQFSSSFPIFHKDRLLAILFVGKVQHKERFNSNFLEALTNILLVAIENKKLARKQLEQEAYRKELEIAKRVQNYLFPKSLPQTSRLRIEAVYLPHHDIGGDYYDYIKLSEDKFVISIADVSGKGVPAALLMSNFQASLRTLLRKTHNLSEIIQELNLSTHLNSQGESFITFFMAMYDFSNNILEFSNCGHNPPMVFSSEGVKLLEEGTTILGMFDPLPFLQISSLSLSSDFLLFCYTDGLTEAFNKQGELYGLDRLVALIKNNQEQALNSIHQLIFSDLDDFRDNVPFADDITMISCSVKI